MKVSRLSINEYIYIYIYIHIHIHIHRERERKRVYEIPYYTHICNLEKAIFSKLHKLVFPLLIVFCKSYIFISDSK